MGRRDLAFRRGSIAVVAAKLLLDLYRAHRRVHLNLGMKFFVVRLRSDHPEIHASRDGNSDGRDQDGDRSEVPGRPRSEPDLRWLSVVRARRRPGCEAIPSGQFPDFAAAAIRAKDEIPDSSEGGEDALAGRGACGAAARRNCADQTQAHRSRTPVQKQVSRVGSLLIQRSGLKFFCLSYGRVPGRSETGAYSKLRAAQKQGLFFEPGGRLKRPPPGRYPWLLHSRYRRARGNRYI